MRATNPPSVNNSRVCIAMQLMQLIHPSSMLVRAVVLRAVVLSTMILLAASVARAADTTAQYAIKPGPLATVLAAFASAADIGVDIDHSLTDGKHSQGLQGEYALTAALAYILRGSGLAAQQLANSRYVIIAAAIDSATTNTPNTPNTLAIPTLTIEDSGVSGYQRDEQGYDAVYDNNASTVYMGRAAVRRNAGTNPADLLQGMAGVFSGDARNSGALDVNIRGVQGPGRVPVIIDGTEQAITVNRGYNGVANRSYIDPNLISSLRVHKGASNARDVNSGIGGALVATTLIPADIIKEGADSGLELIITSGSNAVSPRLNNPTQRVKTLNSKSLADEIPLGGTDFAYRLAVANTSARFDFLAAYAYRRRGNYFAGSNNAAGYYDEPGFYNKDGFYDENGNFDKRPFFISKATGKRIHDRTRALTTYWPAGDEVTNTSSEMGSWLLKSSWRVDNAQKIGFNFRQSDSSYGDVMPAWLITSDAFSHGRIQRPLSEVSARAYNVSYRNTPNDNRWLDLHANLWRTDTLGHTFKAGGPAKSGEETALVKNEGYVDSKHTRDGITLSNTMDLTSTLALTVGGNFQHEKLASLDGKYNNTRTERGGRRQQWGGNFSLAWQPNEALKFSTGMTYSAYWSFDDRLKYIIDAGGTVPQLERILNENITYEYTTGVLYTAEQNKKLMQDHVKNAEEKAANDLAIKYKTYEDDLNDGKKRQTLSYYLLELGFTQDESIGMAFLGESKDVANTRHQQKLDEMRQHLENRYSPDGPVLRQIEVIKNNLDGKEARDMLKLNYGTGLKHHEDNPPIPLLTDAAGKYSFASHPCYNGEVEQAIANKTGDDKTAKITKCFIDYDTRIAEISEAQAEKLQDHGWAPHFAASYQFTPYSRGYVKYSEFIRFPSMFESTMGFSTALGPDGINPEHAYNWEISYVHDLTQWLTTAEYADVKLTFYDNLSKGVIDRGQVLKYLINLDEKKVRGAELTMRYDGGRVFSNIAVNYVLHNEVCDESFAVHNSILEYRVPSCFAFGSPSGGYQITRATPKLSANWALGGRLLDRRLELGSQVTYYSRDANADLDEYHRHFGIDGMMITSFGWDNNLLVNAYANYTVNANLQVEFVAANLTDQYYLDPLTRSQMPAPGRTLKLKLIAKL